MISTEWKRNFLHVNYLLKVVKAVEFKIGAIRDTFVSPPKSRVPRGESSERMQDKTPGWRCLECISLQTFDCSDFKCKGNVSFQVVQHVVTESRIFGSKVRHDPRDR